MKGDDLIGAWDLQFCEGQSTDGRAFHPYGQCPVGRLIYTGDGKMSVVLMSSSRDKFASEDISKATLEEIKQAFESFDAYAGKYLFDEKTLSVEHHIEFGRIPNWVGHSHKRYCSLKEGVLVLKTEPFRMADAEWIVSVGWTRGSQN